MGAIPSAREEAKKWELYVLQGARVRSRMVAPDDIEDPSVFHIGAEKSKASLSAVLTLSVNGPDPVTDPDLID